MTEMKAAFVRTLEDLKNSRLARWQSENGEELKELESSVDSAQGELRDYCRGNIEETKEACENFLDEMASLTALRIERNKIEKAFNLVIECVEIP